MFIQCARACLFHDHQSPPACIGSIYERVSIDIGYPCGLLAKSFLFFDYHHLSIAKKDDDNR
jgi:hypothetical protein